MISLLLLSLHPSCHGSLRGRKQWGREATYPYLLACLWDKSVCLSSCVLNSSIFFVFRVMKCKASWHCQWWGRNIIEQFYNLPASSASSNRPSYSYHISSLPSTVPAYFRPPSPFPFPFFSQLSIKLEFWKTAGKIKIKNKISILLRSKENWKHLFLPIFNHMHANLCNNNCIYKSVFLNRGTLQHTHPLECPWVNSLRQFFLKSRRILKMT